MVGVGTRPRRFNHRATSDVPNGPTAQVFLAVIPQPTFLYLVTYLRSGPSDRPLPT